MNIKAKKKIINEQIAIFMLLIFFLFPTLRTWGMQSSNYRIDEDSINFGGTEDSSSANYRLSDTMGEIGTGEMEEKCSSLDFDGLNDYVDFGDLDTIDGLTQMTVTAWIKLDGTNDDDDIMAKGIHSTNQPLLFWRDDIVGSGSQIGNTNAISIMVYDGDTQAWSSSASGTLDDTDWHYVAFTFEANTVAGLKPYVDGVNNTSADTIGVSGIQSSTNSLIVGVASSIYFGGLIDDVRVYTRVLSSEEINNLYEGKEVNESGLLAKWNFNEGSGLSVYDESGNNNVGTIYGSTFVNYTPATCNILNAGYRQMNETYLAISSPADVTMSPVIGGVTGGTGNGLAVWNVKTDSPAGYQVSAKASTSPALKFGSYVFADYTEASAGIPDYNWSVATADSEFGYTVEGSGAVLKFLDNGSSACNTGSSNTTDRCWYKFATSDFGIVNSSLPNHPLGTDTTIKFKAQSGSGHLQAEGSYEATITVTALPL